MKNKEAMLDECHSKVLHANVSTHECHFSYFVRSVFDILIGELEGRRYLLLSFLAIVDIIDIVGVLLLAMDRGQ